LTLGTNCFFKLLHYHEPRPDVKDLNIRNREKQLFKPLIRLFQNESCLDEILEVISEYISKKRAARVNSLRANLYHILKTLMQSRNMLEFTSNEIWEFIKANLNGKEVRDRPMSYESDEYGMLSQKQIIATIKDVFGAEQSRNARSRKIVFNKDKFDRLGNVYSIDLKIKVGRVQGNIIGLDKHLSPMTDMTDVTDSGDIKASNEITIDKESLQKMKRSDENYNNSRQGLENVSDENNASGDLQADNPSQASYLSPTKAIDEEDTRLLQSGAFWSGSKHHCNNCKYSDDKFGMINHLRSNHSDETRSG
jgi:hypothetical protein